LFSAPGEQIQTAVMSGQRPNINEIQGPEYFEVFARNCVQKCWNQELDQRPPFGG